MPFKANRDRRHHIAKQRHRVTNWAEYDAALRQRGSLTVWFTDAAIAAWRAEPRTTRGGQPRYSALAIKTALTCTPFCLALRQTEGLIGSIIRLLGLDVAVPDHSTLSRRAETLPVLRPRSETSRCTYWSTAPASGALRSRTDRRQTTEMAVAVSVLNRMLKLGRPESVRIAQNVKWQQGVSSTASDPYNTVH